MPQHNNQLAQPATYNLLSRPFLPGSPYDLQAARTDKVSTRQNGASPGSNGASLGEGTANSGRSSNGSSSSSVVQGTDLLEKPYSNNGNGASYQGNGSSYSKQGSAGQRREAAVADALEDAAIIDIDARSSSNADDDDACASGHLGECAVSRSMDIEFQATAQTPECANQQQAAVQEAAESPKTKKSGSNWSRVGKLSTIQVSVPCHSTLLSCSALLPCPVASVLHCVQNNAVTSAFRQRKLEQHCLKYPHILRDTLPLPSARIAGHTSLLCPVNCMNASHCLGTRRQISCTCTP